MEHDTDPEIERPTAGNPDDRANERFTVRASLTGVAQTFTDPREAGAAFFAADPAEHPSVVHGQEGWARTMATTEIHGQHEDGETRYFKTLPSSHAPDAEFRAGFLDAMETSVAERLGEVDWKADAGSRLDTRLQDDLEAFARRAPEKAATLCSGHSGETPPGPEMRAAVRAMEAAAEREARDVHSASSVEPKVIASGDWVTTDRNIELRPVAVATDHGIHTGYEASFGGGDAAITFSERVFPNSREALRHAWDFYEGDEEGLEVAVRERAELDRLATEPELRPEGLVVEHREQPEFPQREVAIYAGEDAQLIVILGRDIPGNRDLAEELVADPGFRKLVAEHVADAEAALGPGLFTDGSDSSGFLPSELLAITAYSRDGREEVLAKFPNESPLSEALASYLVESPVLAAHAERQREQAAFIENPGRAISDWLERSEDAIAFIPWEEQQDLRSEMYGIAAEAAAAFGLDRQKEQIEAPPRSTLYSSVISATSLATGAERTELPPDVTDVLKSGIQAAALEAGIDGAKVERRLETAAANAHQEESWVRSDIAEVAARHRLDLGDDQARGRAAELVDRFYEKAAELVHTARAAEITRDRDHHLVETLGTMANVHASQGTVMFRNEDQARDFAEEMQARYGASVLKDIAEGRTEALAKDVPDESARQAMARAVVAAAKEQPALGFTAQEADAAERKLAALTEAQEQPEVQARERSRDRDREF